MTGAGPDPAPPPGPPRLAIVLPVYRHAMLVSEALRAALGQDAPFGIRVVAVNDGCPDPETDLVLQAFAAAHPDRVTYLRKPNGGLSSARNAGIDHVMAHLPSVEAIFMLDADNRLRPTAMARAMAALEAHPQAGWVYPSIDMFGIRARCDYGGPYSRLIHSEMNVCEAGSLIRRAVFDAGLRFDEAFRLGYEDWHFFLAAGDAGFAGVNLEDFGFFYRKRPESMVADANRNLGLLTGQLRAAHPGLYHPRGQVALEAAEAPRYALHLAGSARVEIVTDPDLAPEVLDLDAYAEAYWRARAAPAQHRVPPFLIATGAGFRDAAVAAGIWHWLLWALEQAALEGRAAYLTAGPAPEAGGLAIAPVPRDTPALRDRAEAWALGPDALARMLSATAPAARPGPGADPPAAAQAIARAISRAGAPGNADTGSGGKAGTGPGGGAGMSPGPGPRAEPGAPARAGPDMKPETGQETGQETGPDTGPEMGPETGPVDAAALPPVAGRRLRADLALSPPAATAALGDALAALAGSRFRAAGQRRWTWRQPSIGWRGREYRIPRKNFEGQPVFPRLGAGRVEIGIVVEDPRAPGLAALLAALQPRRARGARLHLFVLGPAAAPGRDLVPVALDSIALLGLEGFGAPDPQNLQFENVPLRVPGGRGIAAAALGMLYWLDELHDLGGRGAAPLMGPLRRLGIATRLHPGEGPGALALALAYEHAYDRIVVPDPARARLLHARGLPASKLAAAP